MSPIFTAALCLALFGVVAAAAGGISGWRGDGTGRYDDARPVLEWGTETNVVWKTPIPSWSNASPAVAGDKIFICSEPTALLCVDAASGEILWQRANGYDVLGKTDEETAQIRAQVEKAATISRELAAARRDARVAENKLSRSSGDDTLRADVGTLKEKVSRLRAQLKPLDRYILPRKHDANGYSSATPVTDGRHVWAVYGTGTVVCYDIEGDLQWATYIEKPRDNYGFCSSPLLVGDALLVHIDDLTCLDQATGRRRWKIKAAWGWGTAAHTKIGGEDVVFTAKGDMVRVSDGKVLASRLGKLSYNGPVVNGNVVYYIQQDPKAYRLPQSLSGEVKLEKLWQGKIANDRYYGSPLVYEGLIYAITQKNVLTVLDARTGETVYSKKLDLGGGTVYPSITLGGRHIFISHDNGTTIVIEPGRQYRQVAKNKLEAFRSTPLFAGSRMYVRTLKHLYCIGR